MNALTVPAAATLALLLTGILPGQAASPSGPRASAKTLGFVVTQWNTAIYESRFMDECPEGMNPANDEFWWRSLGKEERAKLTNNGTIPQVLRGGISNNRGPNNEDVCQQPELFKDAPLRTAEGPLSYGMNLDGTTDGRETPKTCTHEKFTGVDGTPGVDNQLYRMLGCVYGWRSDGLIEASANGARQTNGLGMILIEVRDVNDTRNDDDVTVAFYRSIDQFTIDAAGSVLPYGTYRIDHKDGVPRYGDTLKGKIVNGTLTTNAGDVALPFYGNYAYQTIRFKDAKLELKLAPDGGSAEGMIGAYYSLDQLWEFIGELGWQPTGSYNCPSIHQAIDKLADGYRDPKTGKCTAMSSAFRIKTTAAFLRSPERKQ